METIYWLTGCNGWSVGHPSAFDIFWKWLILSLHGCRASVSVHLTAGSGWAERVAEAPVWTEPHPKPRFSASSTGSIHLWCLRAMCSPTLPEHQETEVAQGQIKSTLKRWYPSHLIKISSTLHLLHQLAGHEGLHENITSCELLPFLLQMK